MMTPKSVALLALVLVAGSRGLEGQMQVQVTHGQGLSGITGYDLGKETVAYKSARPKTSVPRMSVGDSVCFSITDAHAVFYNYTVGVTVDTTSERLPDVSSAVALLNTAMGGTPTAMAPAARSAMDGSSEIGKFFKMFESLMTSLDAAQKAIKRSDADGIAVAKRAVADIAASPTTDDLTRWAVAAAVADNTTDGKMQVAALDAYGKTLLSTRTALKESYGPNIPLIVNTCAVVSKGSNTVRLDIKKKTDDGQRDVGEGIAEIVVKSRYDRAWVELAPVLLTGFAGDVDEFSIQDSIIKTTPVKGKMLYRPGAVITLNAKLDELTYGPFLGFGVTSENKVSLSDYLGGFMVSYRDAFRLGIGWGRSEIAARLKSTASVGQKFTGDIDDILEKDGKNIVYFTVVLPGLTLKSPWP